MYLSSQTPQSVINYIWRWNCLALSLIPICENFASRHLTEYSFSTVLLISNQWNWKILSVIPSCLLSFLAGQPADDGRAGPKNDRPGTSVSSVARTTRCAVECQRREATGRLGVSGSVVRPSIWILCIASFATEIYHSFQNVLKIEAVSFYISIMLKAIVNAINALYIS